MHAYACQLMLEQSHLGVEVLNPPTPPRCSVRHWMDGHQNLQLRCAVTLLALGRYGFTS